MTIMMHTIATRATTKAPTSAETPQCDATMSYEAAFTVKMLQMIMECACAMPVCMSPVVDDPDANTNAKVNAFKTETNTNNYASTTTAITTTCANVSERDVNANAWTDARNYESMHATVKEIQLRAMQALQAVRAGEKRVLAEKCDVTKKLLEADREREFAVQKAFRVARAVVNPLRHQVEKQRKELENMAAEANKWQMNAEDHATVAVEVWLEANSATVEVNSLRGRVKSLREERAKMVQQHSILTEKLKTAESDREAAVHKAFRVSRAVITPLRQQVEKSARTEVALRADIATLTMRMEDLAVTLLRVDELKVSAAEKTIKATNASDTTNSSSNGDDERRKADTKPAKLERGGRTARNRTVASGRSVLRPCSALSHMASGCEASKCAVEGRQPRRRAPCGENKTVARSGWRF